MIYVGTVDLLQVQICHKQKNEIHNFFKIKSEPEPNIHSNFIVSRFGSSNLFNELTNPAAGLLRQGCNSSCGFRYTWNVPWCLYRVEIETENTHFKLTQKMDVVLGPSGGVIGLAASAGASRSHSRLTGGAVQHMVQAYSTMNRFLARFLEHVGAISFYHHRKKHICFIYWLYALFASFTFYCNRHFVT